MPSSGARFLEDLFQDLSVRLEWLGQVLDSVPDHDASRDALATLRGYASALVELRKGLAHVHSHINDRRFAHLFRLEGALTAYLSRLYAWCEELSGEFERLAVGLREQKPVWTVFSQKAVNGSFSHFQDLNAVLHKEMQGGRSQDAAHANAWHDFESHLEELFWATEWLHLSLAKNPGS
jgi:hypothetical protein